MSIFKNNPIFTKEPYYDEDSRICILLSKKSLLSPLGRINRSAFFLLTLIVIGILFVELYFMVLWNRLMLVRITENPLVVIVYCFLAMYFLFVLAAKRIHDLGWSNILSFLYIVGIIVIPIFAQSLAYAGSFIAIVMIILICIPGEEQDNVYGPVVENIQLFSDSIANKSFGKNINIKCKNVNLNIANKVNSLKNNVINRKVHNVLENNKKKVSISCMVLVITACISYYIYIPKESDIERYRDNNDVVAMCNLVDKAISYVNNDPEYKNIRNQAIRALAKMKSERGNKCLEKYLYFDNSEVQLELKKEIVQAFLENDEKTLLEKYLCSDNSIMDTEN